MGRIPQGINGPIVGKVGTAVGSSWKGIPYLKSSPKKRTKNISEKELANRLRFKKAQVWLSPLLEYLRVGFKGYTATVEGFAAAKSYLLKNVMDKDNQIDPSKMLVSYGDLDLAENISVERTGGQGLRFSWDPTIRTDNQFRQDQVMLLAYDIQNAKADYEVAGEFRTSGSATLETKFIKGQSCHVWIAFVSPDRTRRSNSVYLGEISF